MSLSPGKAHDIAAVERAVANAAKTRVADFARLGPSVVRRVRLGLVQELSPSGIYWGPFDLGSARADQFPFDFDKIEDDCSCMEKVIQQWTHGREFVTPCQPSDPCTMPGGQHCVICRDSTWALDLLRKLDNVGLWLQNGDENPAELFAVKFLHGLRPS